MKALAKVTGCSETAAIAYEGYLREVYPYISTQVLVETQFMRHALKVHFEKFSAK